MEIKIKYFDNKCPRIEKIDKGDFIDLRAANIKSYTDNSTYANLMYKEWGETGILRYKKGDVIKFGLGVAMELPKGYEAVVVPRSSTFKRWGLIQTNSMGVIDHSYKGDSDEWNIEFIATRSGIINRYDRVCQFRIQKNQPEITFKEVEHLGNNDRGGFGSTGVK